MFWELSRVDERKTAVVDEKNAITFGQVLVEAERIQTTINERCVILMLSENSAGSYVGYFAFMSVECIVIILEASVKKEFCQDMIEKYRPQYIWAQKSWKEVLGLDSIYEKYDYYLLKTVYEVYDLQKEDGGGYFIYIRQHRGCKVRQVKWSKNDRTCRCISRRNWIHTR